MNIINELARIEEVVQNNQERVMQEVAPYWAGKNGLAISNVRLSSSSVTITVMLLNGAKVDLDFSAQWFVDLIDTISPRHAEAPQQSDARHIIAQIEEELEEACPGETFKAATKTEAENVANRFMDRCAELLDIICATPQEKAK